MNRRTLLAALAGTATLLGACGLDDTADNAEETTTTEDASAYGVQVASYDLAADVPQRFTVGVLANDGGLVVGGTVLLSFDYQGRSAPAGESSTENGSEPHVDNVATTFPPTDVGSTGDTADDARKRISNVVATFTPVADGNNVTAGPKLRQGDEGVGVYEATGINFEKPGFWEVTVDGTIDGETFSIPASFEVAPTAAIPAAGDPAPRTVNLLPGDPEAPVKAVDSRAEPDGSVPDPELHLRTVADAINSGKPTLVVISTPVFCVSRFCGPITDTVSTMAAEYGDRANFIHIEVWRDFENTTLNRGAAEWIYPDPSTDAREPWVFLVDRQGTVSQRWDNVANGRAMRDAVDQLLS
jgi:hypothetical protein